MMNDKDMITAFDGAQSMRSDENSLQVASTPLRKESILNLIGREGEQSALIIERETGL